MKDVIKRNKHSMFRRVYMKRRLAGEYESTWQRIPQKYITNFGGASSAIDDIKINFLNYSGLNFTVSNIDGYFSPTTESKSFFYGATSILKTLVKIECGYTYGGSEYPTSPVMFVGLIGDNLKYKENTIVNFSTKHLSSIFNELPADQLPGLASSNYTASEIMTKIKDFQDDNGVSVFQKYISSGGWNISTTTDNYFFVTNGSLQDLSCWDLMKKLSEAENMVTYVDRTGDFYFQSKVATSATIFHFSGVGDNDKTWGHNIQGKIFIDDSLRKVYNRVLIQYLKEETITSYKVKKDTWAWGDSTSSFVYGVRTYKYKNTFMSADKASTVADTIYNEYSQPKKEIGFVAKYVPHLEVNDNVTLTYKTARVDGDYLWGHFDWGDGVWGERRGYNINIDAQNFRITSLKHNFNNFLSEIILRED